MEITLNKVDESKDYVPCFSCGHPSIKTEHSLTLCEFCTVISEDPLVIKQCSGNRVIVTSEHVLQ